MIFLKHSKTIIFSMNFMNEKYHKKFQKITTIDNAWGYLYFILIVRSFDILVVLPCFPIAVGKRQSLL